MSEKGHGRLWPAGGWHSRSIPSFGNTPCVPAVTLCATAADAQVFGGHHPNIATTRHATKAIMCRPICIQYLTGVVSL